VQSIGGDECSALTVSMLTDDVQGVGPVALSLPRVVGAAGVARTLWPSLRDDERAALKHSAEVIQAAMAGRW
jgi:L-lactate dehydrogenase